MKELNEKRIQRLVMRSDFPVLAEFFLSSAVNWETEQRKILTTLYRESFHTVLGTLNQRLKEGVFSALAIKYEMAGDEQLRQSLERYLEVVSARKCPLEFGVRSD